MGLDLDRWRADYASEAVAATVETDRQAALALGLSATPTLYVGGRPYKGPLSLAGVRAALRLAASPT